MLGQLVLGLGLLVPIVINLAVVRAARLDGEIRRLKEAVAGLEARVVALARRVGEEPPAPALAPEDAAPAV